MINREDMLALTRRMTVKRTSITRIAGGYMDIDGFIDGTFNTSFLKLSPSEQEKNLALAKKVPNISFLMIKEIRTVCGSF